MDFIVAKDFDSLSAVGHCKIHNNINIKIIRPTTYLHQATA